MLWCNRGDGRSSAKVTAQSGLNMRQGPGINYNVVTVLNNGATVNVVTPDDGNGWLM